MSQGLHIGQAQIEALTGQRVNVVRGVARQHPVAAFARACPAVRVGHLQRPNAAFARQGEAAQGALAGLLQLATKLCRVFSQQGLRPFMRHRPDDGHLVSPCPPQRQKGQNFTRGKPLVRALPVRLFAVQARG